MSFREIGIIISKLQGFTDPLLHLEQYETDGETIAFFISRAFVDIREKRVIDLGSGTGFMSFACTLAGARSAVGVELDKRAIRIALSNLKELARLGYDLNVSFICADVNEFFVKRKFDVCVMNPPFGIQRKFSDRMFLKKSFEVADIVWTFLSGGSEPFVRAFAEENSFEVSAVFKTKMQLRKRFKFHRKKVEFLYADLYRLQRV